MSKFKVGDRIAVYTQCDHQHKRATGTVTGQYDDVIKFRWDGSALIDSAWPQQCRRLKPKRPPLTAWVNRVEASEHLDYLYGQTNWSKESADENAMRTYPAAQKVTTVLMREVRGKKK